MAYFIFLVGFLLLGGLAASALSGLLALILALKAKARFSAWLAIALSASGLAVTLTLWWAFKFPPRDPAVKLFWIPFALGVAGLLGGVVKLALIAARAARVPPKLPR